MTAGMSKRAIATRADLILQALRELGIDCDLIYIAQDGLTFWLAPKTNLAGIVNSLYVKWDDIKAVSINKPDGNLYLNVLFVEKKNDFPVPGESDEEEV